MGNIGTAVTFFSAPAIVNHWGRPTLGWITAAVLVGAAALTAISAHDAPDRKPPAHYLEVLGAGWRLWRLAFFYFITFGGFVALFLLLPTLLQDWFDYSKGEASAKAAGFVIAATLARPVGGWVSDHYGAYPVLVLVFAGVAIDAAVLATLAPAPRIVPVTIACLTLGAFLGAGNGAVFKLVPQEFPDNPGAAGGIVGAAGGLGGFFPPVFVGLVKDAEGTYTYGFVGLLVFVVASLAIAVWLVRTAPVSELRGTPQGQTSV
jgi:NNP family nitrate/nitrite transporter-like MFS transporter